MDRIDNLFESTRGQTVIDYAIAASLFLFVVGAVLLFIPTIYEPLSTSTTSEAIVADKTATYISKELIASSESPATINTICTAAFFGSNTSLDDDCEFTADDSTRDILGVSDSFDVSVYITNTGSETVTTKTVDNTEYILKRETATTEQNTAVATRIVNLNDEPHRLTVEVW